MNLIDKALNALGLIDPLFTNDKAMRSSLEILFVFVVASVATYFGVGIPVPEGTEVEAALATFVGGIGMAARNMWVTFWTENKPKTNNPVDENA